MIRLLALDGTFAVCNNLIMLRKIFYIVMAFVLVASNLGLTLSTHYCQGEALESQINLTPVDLGCGMTDMVNSCALPLEHHDDETHIDNIPCCENEYQTIQPTEDFIQETTPITFNVDFAIALVYTTLNLDLFPNSTQHFYTAYHSPPIEKDIQVLFQTFLI